jgi:anti-sigma regulatory factor (Ser/Thr protein kinase)
MSASATATTSAAPDSATRAAAGRASADLARIHRGEGDRRGPGKGAVPAPSLPPQWRGTTMADHWPLQDFIEYGALPSAVPSARLHTRQIVWEWGLTALTETVELLVSELVTNGIAATPPAGAVSPVRLWLLSDGTQILILVWDASPHPPVPAEVDGYAESGRGLLLVEALSERWGSYATAQAGGKIVWALCRKDTAERRCSSRG